jgi:hypothetical protein
MIMLQNARGEGPAPLGEALGQFCEGHRRDREMTYRAEREALPVEGGRQWCEARETALRSLSMGRGA